MAQQQASAVRKLFLKTPLLYSEALSAALGDGRRVFLKMDALQPPGSFKIRGISNTIQKAVEAGARHVISSSGGNAGLAAAYCARELGVKCTVVLPSTTPGSILDRLRTYGAEALVHGAVWDEANERALKISQQTDGCLVHPFDQPDTWEGHATVVKECKTQFVTDLGQPDDFCPSAFVTCVGGGGLLMGILQGLESVGWSDRVAVVASETKGADSMAQALAAGKLVTLPGISSIAKSLGATRVSETIFKKCLELGSERVRPWVCSDRQAVEACARFADDHRVLVEPACGAALAAVYHSSAALDGCSDVVVEVCGGSIIDRESLQNFVVQTGAFT